MLSKMVEAKLKDENLSLRQAAKIIGMRHTTILRALRGETVDLDTVFRFAKWLEVKPSTLLDVMSEEEDALADKITVVLKQSPKLTATFEEAIKELVEGRISTAIIQDIAAYAAYRINLARK